MKKIDLCAMEVTMGDEIILISAQVIQGGLFQLDFRNEETKSLNRCFVTAQRFFQMIGASLQNAHIEHLEAEGWVKDEEN